VRVLALLLLGCSQPNVVADGGVDASPASDSGKRDTGTDAAVVDTGTEDVLNGCGETDFVDRSGEGGMRTITWDFNVDPRCVRIAPGESVTWQGLLANHPLSSLGGDMPTPIVTTNTGTSVTFVFSDAGDYGFVCLNHQPMTGVIRAR
jgi:plastocyanin